MIQIKQLLTTVLTVAALLLVSSAQALNLEITQGIDKAMTIGVYALSSSAVKIPGNKTMSQVITNDLTMSGQFEVTPMAYNNQLHVSPTQIAQWQQQNLNDVVFGSIKKDADGYAVTIQLMDLTTQALLWHHTFHAAQNQLRQIAHQVSNQIYTHLTGKKGIFTTKLAYIHMLGEAPGPKQYRLEVSDVDGFNPQVLVVSDQPLMSPAWSPDGKQIAYVSFESGQPAIYVQQLADGSRVKMSAVTGINGAPTFSPDGKSLAMVQIVKGVPHIVEMALNTGKVTNLTSGYAADTEPAFSPDGQSLLFTSTRDGGLQLYQLNLANKQVQRLTYAGDYNASGTYFPAGQSIAFLHEEQGMLGIAMRSLTGNEAPSILDENDTDASPSIAPNGQLVLYSTTYQGHRVLAVVSTDGQMKLRLPADQGSVQDPAWSPFLSGGE